MKELLKEIFGGMYELESFDIIDVLDDVLSKVACIVAVPEKMGIKVRWLDKVIRDICPKRDHSILMEENQRLFTRLGEL